MSSWILAIDFGTSYTVAAARVGDRPPEVIEVGGERRVPSVVLVDEHDGVLVGRPADDLSVTHPANALRAIKNRLGDQLPVVLAGRPHNVVHLVAALLRDVYVQTVRQMGEPPAEVRLTHPATWSVSRMKRLLEAAEKAELVNTVLVSEPVAAALSYVHEVGLEMGQNIAVYDLGGGTFDAAVVTSQGGEFVIAGRPLGDQNIGGELFDEVLVNFIGEQLDPTVWNSILVGEETVWQQVGLTLRNEARKAKEALSSHHYVNVIVPLPTAGLSQTRLTRMELEELVRPHIAETIVLLERCVAEAGLDASQLAGISLVGGSSRSPLVEEMVCAAFPTVPVSRRGDPKAAVAIGATRAYGRSVLVTPRPAEQVTQEASAGTARQDVRLAPPPQPPPPTPLPPPPPPPTPPTAVPTRRLRRAWIVAAVLLVAAGALIAVVATSGDDASNANLPLGTLIATLPGDNGPIRAIAFAPDGDRVVTASDDGTAHVFDAHSGAVVATMSGHQATVRSTSFSPDGTKVVTASDDWTARVWDATSGTELIVFAAHEAAVIDATFSPDGAWVVTASLDGNAKVWSTDQGNHVSSLKGHTDALVSANFSPDGAQVVTASLDGTARVWDAATGTPITTLSGHGAALTGAEFNGDGSRVITASEDGTARVWDPSTAEQLWVLDGQDGIVYSAAFSPDGSKAVTSSNNTARLWDLSTGQKIHRFDGHNDAVVMARFSPDGDLVATASRDGTARVWDVGDGSELAQMNPDDGEVLDVVFEGQGAAIATGSAGGEADVWAG